MHTRRFMACGAVAFIAASVPNLIAQEQPTPSVALQRGLCGVDVGRNYDQIIDNEGDRLGVMEGSLETPDELAVEFSAVKFVARDGRLVQVVALLDSAAYERLKAYVESEWGPFDACKQRGFAAGVKRIGPPMDAPEGEWCSVKLIMNSQLGVRIWLWEVLEERELRPWGEEYMKSGTYSKVLVRCLYAR